MSLYAQDGSINVSITASPTGSVYAPDGSIYVVQSSGSANGSRHSSGAWNVTKLSSPTSNYYATDGSINVDVSPYSNGGQRVTVVSGSWSGGGGSSSPTFYILGF